MLTIINFNNINMRKHLLTIGLFVAGSLFATAQTNFSMPRAFQNKQRALTTTVANTTAESKIVYSEDFSKFTAGSEDAPDATDISGSQAEGYVINPDYLSQPGWYGKGVHQAGGACAIRIYEYQYEGYPEVYTACGYISTPESEFFGDVEVTFRARKFAGDGTFWVGLCDNAQGPVDEKVFTLTEEWAEYSFKSNKGTFAANNVIQFAARNETEVLIDDIVIKRAITKTETPQVLPALNKSFDEFVARWNPTKTADKYLFNVFKKVDNPDHVEGTLKENFDAINVKEDGISIDTDKPNYPEGWNIDVSTNGSQDMCKDEGMYSTAPQSIVLDEVGDYIETPILPAPAKEIRFWIYPSSYDYEYTISMFSVLIHNAKEDTWTPIANIPNYYLQPYGIVYKFTKEQIGLGIDQVRFEYIQKGEKAVKFIIDDVEVDYATQKLDVPVLENVETTDTFYVVKGIEPENEHYYYVQAVQGDLISDRTPYVWVDGYVGLKPVINMPTNVTQTSFDISWTKFNNNPSYVVDISRVVEAKEDMQGVTILEEGFDKIETGTFDMPGMDWNPRYDFGANGMCDSHWTADQAQWIEGMAGTRGTNAWTGIPGFISSPKLNLSNNGGAFDVELTVYTMMDNDEVAVMIQKNLDENATLYKTFKCEGALGTYSATVNFEEGGEKDCHISIMSLNGNPIFLDNIKITQNLKKGEMATSPFRITNTTENKLSVTDLPAGSDYGVQVKAMTVKDYYTYTSEASDVMVVYTSVPTGINNVEDNGINIVAVEGGVRIMGAPDGSRAEVFNIQGQLVNVVTVNDNADIQLPRGIYVVKVTGKQVKVVVR